MALLKGSNLHHLINKLISSFLNVFYQISLKLRKSKVIENKKLPVLQDGIELGQ